MCSSPILSIIIVTFNAEPYVARTLRSVGSQTAGSGSYEIIVIDGASTDRTLEIVDESGLALTLVSEADSGIYDAMNKGAARASGQWIQFLNAGDTFTSSTSLKTIVEALDKEKPVWAVTQADNLGGGSGPRRRIPSVPHRWIRHAFGLQPHCHQACFFKRTTFLESGGHSLSYGTAGDFDLILRFGLLYPPVVIEGTNIDYLGGGISDGQWRNNSLLQHQVRKERFSMSRTAALSDSLWVSLSTAYLRTRSKLGKFKSKLHKSPAEGSLN